MLSLDNELFNAPVGTQDRKCAILDERLCLDVSTDQTNVKFQKSNSPACSRVNYGAEMAETVEQQKKSLSLVNMGPI